MTSWEKPDTTFHTVRVDALGPKSNGYKFIISYKFKPPHRHGSYYADYPCPNRDLAVEDPAPNREALRELTRGTACQLLKDNQNRQDEITNRHRHTTRQFNINDLVFVIKFSQVTGKLDPGMRGPYMVIKVLLSGCYALRLLSGSYGKTTQAAAQHMVPWWGEWCPDTCAAFFEGEHTDHNKTTSGLSMPPLDVEVKDPELFLAGSSSISQGEHAEDDMRSGEAV